MLLIPIARQVVLLTETSGQRRLLCYVAAVILHGENFDHLPSIGQHLVEKIKSRSGVHGLDSMCC